MPPRKAERPGTEPCIEFAGVVNSEPFGNMGDDGKFGLIDRETQAVVKVAPGKSGIDQQMGLQANQQVRGKEFMNKYRAWVMNNGGQIGVTVVEKPDPNVSDGRPFRWGTFRVGDRKSSYELLHDEFKPSPTARTYVWERRAVPYVRDGDTYDDYWRRPHFLKREIGHDEKGRLLDLNHIAEKLSGGYPGKARRWREVTGLPEPPEVKYSTKVDMFPEGLGINHKRLYNDEGLLSGHQYGVKLLGYGVTVISDGNSPRVSILGEKDSVHPDLGIQVDELEMKREGRITVGKREVVKVVGTPGGLELSAERPDLPGEVFAQMADDCIVGSLELRVKPFDDREVPKWIKLEQQGDGTLELTVQLTLPPVETPDDNQDPDIVTLNATLPPTGDPSIEVQYPDEATKYELRHYQMVGWTRTVQPAILDRIEGDRVHIDLTLDKEWDGPINGSLSVRGPDVDDSYEFGIVKGPQGSLSCQTGIHGSELTVGARRLEGMTELTESIGKEVHTTVTLYEPGGEASNSFVDPGLDRFVHERYGSE